MRLADFVVYYMVSYYKKKHMDGLFFGTILNRAVYLASLNVGLSLVVVAQIVYFMFLKKNLLMQPFAVFAIVIPIYLLSERFDYLYKKQKRYEYLLSEDFTPFTLDLLIGVRISFIWFLLAFLSMIGLAS
jgi:hypothetical protein